MVRARVMFRPIIRQVVFAWPPVKAELSLRVAAAEPVEIHVDRFGGFHNNFVVNEAMCR